MVRVIIILPQEQQQKEGERERERERERCLHLSIFLPSFHDRDGNGLRRGTVDENGKMLKEERDGNGRGVHLSRCVDRTKRERSVKKECCCKIHPSIQTCRRTHGMDYLHGPVSAFYKLLEETLSLFFSTQRKTKTRTTRSLLFLRNEDGIESDSLQRNTQLVAT